MKQQKLITADEKERIEQARAAKAAKDKKKSTKVKWLIAGVFAGIAITFTAIYYYMQSSTGNEWVDRGYEYYEEGAYTSTLKCCHNALLHDPENGEAYILKAKVHATTDYYAGIAYEMDFAFERIDEPTEEMYYMRGKSNYKLGKYGKAIPDLEKVRELNPNADSISYFLAESYLERDDKTSLQYYLEYLSMNESSFESAFSAATIYRKSKSNDEAIKLYDAAISITPNSAEAWYGKALAQKDKGLSDEACLSAAKANNLGSSEAYEFVENNCIEEPADEEEESPDEE